MRKSDVTLRMRNDFERQYGRRTLRALVAIRKQAEGISAYVDETSSSLAAYKANLTRGAYRPFVGPSFRNDKLNLLNCNR